MTKFTFELLLFINSLCLGIVTSISDVKKNKIYNKYLTISIIVSLLVYFIYFIDSINFNLCINIALILMLPYFFYRMKIWAAGDGKLYSAFMFTSLKLLDNPIKVINYQAKVLVYIFAMSFSFLIINNIIEKIKTKKKRQSYRFKIESKFFFSFSVLFLINKMFIYFFGTGYFSNRSIFIILNIYLSSILEKIEIRKKSIQTMFKIIFFIILLLMLKNQKWVEMSLIYLLGIVIFIRYLMDVELYNRVKIKNLKEGMLMNKLSIIMLINNGIKFDSDFYQTGIVRENELNKLKTLLDNDYELIIEKKICLAPFIAIGFLIAFLLGLR